MPRWRIAALRFGAAPERTSSTSCSMVSGSSPRSSYASPTDTTPSRAAALSGSGPFSTAAARATEARDTPIISPAWLSVTSSLRTDSRLATKAR